MRSQILIVDDSAAMGRFMGEVLQPLGDVRFAMNGVEGLELARAQVPDLILLDGEMPGLNGYDVCVALKSDPLLCDVPVIFVTAHCDPAFELRCLDAGAADFISKPISQPILLARAHTHLRLQRLARERRLAGTPDALSQLANRLEIAAESAGIGVWEYDVVAGTLAWDSRMFEIYGVNASSQREPYSLWAESLHPEDRQRIEDELAAGLQGASKFDTEFRIVRPDGQERHVKASALLLRNREGTAIRLTGTNLDVTERKRAELELRETMALLHAVLASATQVAILAVDCNGLVKVFNRGAEQLLGYRSDEVVGRHSALIFHDAKELTVEAQRLGAQLGVAVATEEALIHPTTLGHAKEWTYLRKNGTHVPVSLTITAMCDERGQLVGYVGMAYDVSQRKEYENTLRAATLKAEQANLAKSRFLANMSHEIRTPLHALIGMAHLLEQTPLDLEQTTFLGNIRLAGKSLLAIVNDVLDLSKIEASELILEDAPFCLASLLDEIDALLGSQAKARKLAFEIERPNALPMLRGDAVRLQQILVNLLSNAFKFTERGSVCLGVSTLSESAGRVNLRFVVRDTGVGIAPESMSRLFNRFVQEDESTTRRFGGTGLGLSIVRHLANLMGGEVGGTSEQLVGSEFWVELGFAMCRGVAAVEPVVAASDGQVPNLAGVRVLVVDDSKINLAVARLLLEREAAVVSVSNNGQEAVDLLRKGRLRIPTWSCRRDRRRNLTVDLCLPSFDGQQRAVGSPRDARSRAVADNVAATPLHLPNLFRPRDNRRGRLPESPFGGDEAGNASRVGRHLRWR